MALCQRKRLLLFAVFGLAVPLLAQKADELSDFDAEKFEQWQKQGPRQQIPWKINFTQGGLSFFQRPTAHIDIQADADHILKRGKSGRVIAMVQLTDQKGEKYRNDGKIELSEMKEVRNANVVFSWDAFVLPGEYQAELALYDPQSGEHNFGNQRLHISPLKRDVLPGSWEGLPPVEFWAPKEHDTDNLYHPDIDGKLKLQIATTRPLRTEVLADVTPSETFGGSKASFDLYLAMIVPMLKVFSQMELPTGSLEVATLDLKNRKVIFKEEVKPEKNGLDWLRLKDTLKASDPDMVNVRVLQDHHPSPAFLRDELLRRIAADTAQSAQDKNAPLHVYILLSASLDPYSFNATRSGPIPESLPEKCSCLIYYLEYDLFWGRRGLLKTVNKVEKMLAPFKVRTFSISSTMDARKALAEMVEEIAKAGAN